MPERIHKLATGAGEDDEAAAIVTELMGGSAW
jgi:hypothetical protein